MVIRKKKVKTGSRTEYIDKRREKLPCANDGDGNQSARGGEFGVKTT
jgi:hypothetical protein